MVRKRNFKKRYNLLIRILKSFKKKRDWKIQRYIENTNRNRW